MSAIAERVYQKLNDLPLIEQEKVLAFTDFIYSQQPKEFKGKKADRPIYAHPTLSNIALNYDPTESLTDDEWGNDVR